VSVTSDGEYLAVTVIDDGIGFDSTRRHAGLGLRGIEERVKELQGALTIDKADTGGTKLAIRLPWRTPLVEVPFARAAG
jgi:signal transduction histidine kinase